MRILVVEDEAITREILTELLRAEGYEVDSVATAGAATTCIDSISYSLVVADWVLPDGMASMSPTRPRGLAPRR